MNEPDRARTLIDKLQLSPHPEGGFFRETYRGAGDPDERARATAILFLLQAGEHSHWHRVDADEIWIWQGGDPLSLDIARTDDGPLERTVLGIDVERDETPQGLVPAGAWQAARAASKQDARIGYSLVSCIVSPGFEFDSFILAPPGWSPGEPLSP